MDPSFYTRGVWDSLFRCYAFVPPSLVYTGHTCVPMPDNNPVPISCTPACSQSHLHFGTPGSECNTNDALTQSGIECKQPVKARTVRFVSVVLLVSSVETFLVMRLEKHGEIREGRFLLLVQTALRPFFTVHHSLSTTWLPDVTY